MTQVAVIGLGLIGGSLARRLAAAHDVVVFDEDAGTRNLARAAGLTAADELTQTVSGAAIVFVAVPMPALSTMVSQVVPALSASAVVTDVGSVKAPLYAAVRAQGMGARFVGGHPMAGTERSGFAASDPCLYDGAAWVLCLEPDTVLPSWLRVAAVLTGIGVRVVPATAAEHDAAVARVSHLPHLLAAALASTAAAAGPLALTLAAGSFRDGTRVAATAPRLTVAMCRANGEAVEAAVAETVDLLRASGPDPGLLLAAGHQARRAWENREIVTTDLATGAVGLADRLLELGRRGGWVERIGEHSLSVAAPASV